MEVPVRKTRPDSDKGPRRPKRRSRGAGLHLDRVRGGRHKAQDKGSTGAQLGWRFCRVGFSGSRLYPDYKKRGVCGG